MEKMIVDSKVSLTAYEKYINEEEDELKVLKRACKLYKTSCRAIRKQNYQDLYQIESPDFVFYLFLLNPHLQWL
jgi:DNA recombination protein RmuC